MNKKKKEFNNILASWLIALSILGTVFFKLFEVTPMVMVGCVALSIISVVPLIRDLTKDQFINLKKTVAIIIGVWLLCVFVAVLQGADKPLRLEELERIIYTFLLTYLFCNTKISLVPLKIVLYLIIVFFYYQYFVVGITTYGVNDLGSGAVNTVILLTISITIQVLDYRDNHRISLLPALLIVPIAVMSWNRTGFIASLLYVITVFIIGVSHTKKKSSRYILVFFSIVFLLFIVVRFYDSFTETSLFSKFETGALDNTPRLLIWGSYFSGFDIVQFLFGRPIDNSHPLIAGFLNPHNSYIMLHSQVGVLAVLFLIVVIKRFWLYFKNNRYVFFMFLVLFIRGFFDMAFFFQPFDYAFYLFLFDYKRLMEKHQDINIRII